MVKEGKRKRTQACLFPRPPGWWLVSVNVIVLDGKVSGQRVSQTQGHQEDTVGDGETSTTAMPRSLIRGPQTHCSPVSGLNPCLKWDPPPTYWLESNRETQRERQMERKGDREERGMEEKDIQR